MLHYNSLIFVSCFLAFTFGKSLASQDTIENHSNYHLLDPAAECGQPGPVFSFRIREGIRVESGEMPWMVYLTIEKLILDTSGHCPKPAHAIGGCGGTLISKRYVLTAAHCTIHADKVYVYFPQGNYDLDQCPFPEREHKCVDKYDLAERIINHSEYNDTTLHNDISLLRLSKNVKFNNHMMPICLPTRSDYSKLESLDSMVTAAGWGHHSDSPQERKIDNSLLKVELYLQKCEEKMLVEDTATGIDYEVPSIPSQICAGNKGRYDRGICDGDSGGPIQTRTMINNSYKYVQIGISSAGSPCYEVLKSLAQDTFTRVSSFLPWILDQLEE